MDSFNRLIWFVFQGRRNTPNTGTGPPESPGVKKSRGAHPPSAASSTPTPTKPHTRNRSSSNNTTASNQPTTGMCIINNYYCHIILFVLLFSMCRFYFEDNVVFEMYMFIIVFLFIYTIPLKPSFKVSTWEVFMLQSLEDSNLKWPNLSHFFDPLENLVREFDLF